MEQFQRPGACLVVEPIIREGMYAQLFQSSNLIMDIATYRLNQPRGQCSENHLKCITRWEGRDGVPITIFFQHTRDGHKISNL